MSIPTLDDIAVRLVQLDLTDEVAIHDLRAMLDAAVASTRFASPVKASLVQALLAFEDDAGDASSHVAMLAEVRRHLEHAMALHDGGPAAAVQVPRTKKRGRTSTARGKRDRRGAPAKGPTIVEATVRAGETCGVPPSASAASSPLLGSAVEAPSPPSLARESRSVLDIPLVSPDADRSLVTDFVAESREYLEGSEAALLRLESVPRDAEAVNTIFRAFHTIKGTSSFLGVQSVMALAHEAETLLGRMRDGSLVCSAETADLIFGTIDTLKLILEQVERVMAGETAVLPPSFDIVLAQLRHPDEGQVAARGNGFVPERSDATLGAAPGAAASRTGVSSGASGAVDAMVRVRTNRLDQLIEMVGELVIAQSMLSQDATVRHAGNYELARKVGHAEKIVRELQDLSMAMRMVPLRGPFQKVTRLVRDLAHRNGKVVDVRTDGEATEIDRNLVDVLSDPLVHMVRNAVDHGLELPENRERAGKPRVGTIRIAAYHSGGNVVVELSDDGRGLDRDKIVRKAVDLGLLESSEGLSVSEIDNLIFLPGFSTAEQVSEISGRGVGMDVVRRNVEAMRGRVEITSQPGKGTTFTIRLPLTLAITDGMLVRVGEERYLVPTGHIRLSFRPEPSQLSTIAGRGEIVMLRGEVTPVVRLHRLFGVDGAVENPTEALLMLVGDGRDSTALLVDELLGQQQVVAKSLGNGIGRAPGVSGGAILGDGRVGLILDVAELVGLARNSATGRAVA